MVKKIFLSLLAGTAITTNVYAESNGIFLGVGAGITNRGENVIIKDTSGNINSNKKYNDNEALVELILGYKHYIGDSDFGLRYYASVTSNLTADKDDVSSAPYENYDANIDMLYNFTSNKSTIGFGIFAGGFVGGSVYHVKSNNISVRQDQTAKVDKTAFRSGANLGLRLMFGDHNSLELASKIVLKSSEVSQLVSDSSLSRQAKYTQRYNVSLRYVLSF